MFKNRKAPILGTRARHYLALLPFAQNYYTRPTIYYKTLIQGGRR